MYYIKFLSILYKILIQLLKQPPLFYRNPVLWAYLLMLSHFVNIAMPSDIYNAFTCCFIFKERFILF